MKIEPHVPLLDRRSRARVWLLAPTVGALVPAVLLTADEPPLLGVVLGVWMAAVVVVGVWAVRDLALPDPASQARPVTGADLLAGVSTVQVIAPTRMPRGRPYDDELLATAEDAGVYVPRHACDTLTTAIPQVTA